MTRFTMTRFSFMRFVGAALLPLPAVTASAQGGAKVLRMVPQTDLKILDPIWTTAFVTRNHGYMIYDTLFGTDAEGKVKPQMVDKYRRRPDEQDLDLHAAQGPGVPRRQAGHRGRRDRLAQALGPARQPGAEDVRRSSTRWNASDRQTFASCSRSPSAWCWRRWQALVATSPFIMPKRVADTPADKQIDDYTGSGPFIFKKDEFKPGDKVVYVKNTKYVPRSEAPSGTGRRQDRLRRPRRVDHPRTTRRPRSTRCKTGEVDMLRAAAVRALRGAAKATRDIELVERDRRRAQYILRLNHLHAAVRQPEDRARPRSWRINQEAFLHAQVGVPRPVQDLHLDLSLRHAATASDKTGVLHRQAAFEKAQGSC